jgi:hypothetical protein
MFRSLPSLGPSCARLEAERLALLRSIENEAQIARRVKALREVLKEAAVKDCINRQAAELSIDNYTVVRRSLVLIESKEARVTVERLAAGSDVAIRRWNFLLTAETPKSVAWLYRNEEEWLVDAIVRDIAEMVRYAGRGRLTRQESTTPFVSGGARPGQYQLTWTLETGEAPIAHIVTLEPHLWSGSAYAPFAVAGLERLGLAPATPTWPDETLLARLTDLRAPVIEKENQRVSEMLARAILDPEPHEQAALTLGALALREAAGSFSDIRHTLCRMTAHLALARALRGGAPYRLHGALAETVLLTLVGRSQEALKSVSSLKGNSNEGLGAWLNALTLRNTADWRTLARPEAASLLERLEYLRALYRSQDSQAALDFFERQKPEPVADWGRIVLARRFTVEEGNRFVASAIEREIDEVHQVRAASSARHLVAAELVEALNVDPGRCLVPNAQGLLAPQVIGWGLWARFLQRHILEQIDASYEHLGVMLGLPEQLQHFRHEMETVYGTLKLYAFVEARLALWERNQAANRGEPLSSDLDQACEPIVALMSHQPEVVTATEWSVFTDACSLARQAGRLPGYADWFSTGFPRGTTYDAWSRLTAPALSLRFKREDLEQARELAPFDFIILQDYAHRTSPGADVAKHWATVLHPLSDYHVAALSRLAELSKEESPVEYRRLTEKLCELSPIRCIALGDYLASMDLDDEAAAAYQRAADGARDRVTVSKNTGWLVDYYYRRGRKSEAFSIAAMASQVYSAGGLYTMGRLQERAKNYGAARSYYDRIQERYGDEGPLTEFFVRYSVRVGDGRFAEESRIALDKLFPRGLERVTFSDFREPPEEGVRILTSTGKLKRLGLRPGDVIVALDGYRIRNVKQYRLVRSLTEDPKMGLVVWHDDRYLEVQAARPYRSLGSELGPYRAPGVLR